MYVLTKVRFYDNKSIIHYPLVVGHMYLWFSFTITKLHCSVKPHTSRNVTFIRHLHNQVK